MIFKYYHIKAPCFNDEGIHHLGEGILIVASLHGDGLLYFYVHSRHLSTAVPPWARQGWPAPTAGR